MRTLTAALLCVLAASASWGQPSDFAQVVFAPSRIDLGPGLRVGMRYERRREVEGVRTTSEWLAVVGETKDAWEIETTGGLSSTTLPREGRVLALVVDKRTGKVLTAALGKPGQSFEDREEVKIHQPRKAHPKPVAATVQVGDQEIPAEVLVVDFPFGGKIRTYLGRKGTPLAGVLLEFRGKVTYAVTQLPSEGRFQLEGDKDAEGKLVSIKVLEAQYSNGESRAYTRHAVAVALSVEAVLHEWEGGTERVVSLRTNAKKTLAWK